MGPAPMYLYIIIYILKEYICNTFWGLMPAPLKTYASLIVFIVIRLFTLIGTGYLCTIKGRTKLLNN